MKCNLKHNVNRYISKISINSPRNETRSFHNAEVDVHFYYFFYIHKAIISFLIDLSIVAVITS